MSLYPPFLRFSRIPILVDTFTSNNYKEYIINQSTKYISLNYYEKFVYSEFLSNLSNVIYENISSEDTIIVTNGLSVFDVMSTKENILQFVNLIFEEPYIYEIILPSLSSYIEDTLMLVDYIYLLNRYTRDKLYLYDKINNLFISRIVIDKPNLVETIHKILHTIVEKTIVNEQLLKTGNIIVDSLRLKEEIMKTFHTIFDKLNEQDIIRNITVPLTIEELNLIEILNRNYILLNELPSISEILKRMYVAIFIDTFISKEVTVTPRLTLITEYMKLLEQFDISYFITVPFGKTLIDVINEVDEVNEIRFNILTDMISYLEIIQRAYGIINNILVPLIFYETLSPMDVGKIFTFKVISLNEYLRLIDIVSQLSKREIQVLYEYPVILEEYKKAGKIIKEIFKGMEEGLYNTYNTKLPGIKLLQESIPKHIEELKRAYYGGDLKELLRLVEYGIPIPIQLYEKILRKFEVAAYISFVKPKRKETILQGKSQRTPQREFRYAEMPLIARTLTFLEYIRNITGILVAISQKIVSTVYKIHETAYLFSTPAIHDYIDYSIRVLIELGKLLSEHLNKIESLYKGFSNTVTDSMIHLIVYKILINISQN